MMNEKKALQYFTINIPENPEQSEAYLWARKALTAAIYRSKWVSVEERLPSVSGTYICAVKDTHEKTWTIPSKWSLRMKTWFGTLGKSKTLLPTGCPFRNLMGRDDGCYYGKKKTAKS